jgi:hypothetical protein
MEYVLHDFFGVPVLDQQPKALDDLAAKPRSADAGKAA